MEGRRMFRRLTAGALALTMLVSGVPGAAFALDEGSDGGGGEASAGGAGESGEFALPGNPSGNFSGKKITAEEFLKSKGWQPPNGDTAGDTAADKASGGEVSRSGGGGSGGGGNAGGGDEFSDERVIVRVSGDSVQAFSEGKYFGIEVDEVSTLVTLDSGYSTRSGSGSAPDTIRVLTLKEKGSEAVMQAVEKLNGSAGIVYAEPDYIVRKFEAGSDLQGEPSDLPGGDSEEPMFSAQAERETPIGYNATLQWGMEKIMMPEAWKITKGSRTIDVAVMDSGIDYLHLALIQNIRAGGNNRRGRNFTNDGSAADITDDDGHGTHVSGTIGATANGVGVAQQVTLVPVKVLDSQGRGFTSWMIDGFDWAANNGAHVVNMSLGSPSYAQALYDAIENRPNILVVAAAGNDGNNIDIEPEYPASFDLPNIISVAASNNSDNLASFSNYSARLVHIAAPGVWINSTVKGGGFEGGTQADQWNGTSMAAPHVAGAAALLLSQNSTMTPGQIKDRLFKSANPVAALEGKTTTGTRLNVYNAVANLCGTCEKALSGSGDVCVGHDATIGDYHAGDLAALNAFANIGQNRARLGWTAGQHATWAGVTWSTAGGGDEARVTSISMNYRGVSGALDVSALSELTGLYCRDNSLTSINASGLTKLKDLVAGGNSLTTLNISGSNILENLFVNDNNLTTLTISALASTLKQLNVGENKLTSLSAAGFANLEFLSCYSNELSTLPLTGAVKLKVLECDDNNLTALDLSGLSALEWLNCADNNLTTLDVSSKSNLEELYCYSNRLSSINLSGSTGNLETIWFHDNRITALAWLASATKLELVRMEHNHVDLNGVANITALNTINSTIETNQGALYYVPQYYTLTYDTGSITGNNNSITMPEIPNLQFTQTFGTVRPNMTNVRYAASLAPITEWGEWRNNTSPPLPASGSLAKAWQTSRTFTGLTASTTYYVYAIYQSNDRNIVIPYPTTGFAASTGAVAPGAPGISGTPGATTVTLTRPTANVVAADTIEYAVAASNNVSAIDTTRGTGGWQTDPTFNNLQPSTRYWFFARKATNGTVPASSASASRNATTAAMAIAGTVAINFSGALEAGKVLTAVPTLDSDPAGTPPTTGITYEWFRVTAAGAQTRISGANTSTYTPVAADLDRRIRVVVKATGYTGEVTATTTGMVQRAELGESSRPDDFSALVTKTHNSVTLPTYTQAQMQAKTGVASGNTAQYARSATQLTSDVEINALTWGTNRTFSGLNPRSTHYFYVRFVNPAAMTLPRGVEVETNGSPQSAPGAPGIGGTPGATGITLTRPTNAGADEIEYAVSATNNISGMIGSWQVGLTFTGLSPNTSYWFFARRIATATHHASPQSSARSAKTSSASISSAGSAVVVTGVEAFGGTLRVAALEVTTEPANVTIGTLRYQWQRQNANGTWANIGKNLPEYTLVAADVGRSVRVTVSAANCAGSVSSASISITAAGGTGAPIVNEGAIVTTAARVTLPRISGAEYALYPTASLGGINENTATYQTSNVFNVDSARAAITGGTQYTWYIRVRATATRGASDAATGTAMTPRAAVRAPAAPVIATGGVSPTSITINRVANMEYTIHTSNRLPADFPADRWVSGAGTVNGITTVVDGNSLRFENLKPRTSYFFFARTAQTATAAASPASSARAQATTPAAIASANFHNNGMPLNVDPVSVGTTLRYSVNTITFADHALHAGRGLTIADGGTPKYQWKRVTTVNNTERVTNIGTNSPVYTVAAADMGNRVFLEVTYPNFSGAATSARLTVNSGTINEAFVNKELGTDNANVTVTHNSITFPRIVGAEYRMTSRSDGATIPTALGNFRTSNAFTGLAPNVTYGFAIRVKSTAGMTSEVFDTPVAVAGIVTSLAPQAAIARPGENTAARTAVSVTLTRPSNAGTSAVEYARSTTNNINGMVGDWGESAVFTELDPNTQYWFFARRKTTAGNAPSAASPALSVRTARANLTDATISLTFGGDAVAVDTDLKIGNTLTAGAISALTFNNTGGATDFAGGVMKYQWKRLNPANGRVSNIGRNQNSYTLVAADIGSRVFVEITYANFTGSAKSIETKAVEKLDGPMLIGGTELEIVNVTGSATRATATLTRNAGFEYRIKAGAGSFGNWQTGNTFSNLTIGTAYSFEMRARATATVKEGAAYTLNDVTLKFLNQTVPAIPRVTAMSGTHITVAAASNFEYLLQNGNFAIAPTATWVDGATATEGALALSHDNSGEYYIWARAKETATHSASNPSIALRVVTAGGNSVRITAVDGSFSYELELEEDDGNTVPTEGEEGDNNNTETPEEGDETNIGDNPADIPKEDESSDLGGNEQDDAA
ncbi:MAG: S8 family serine peptidase [Oscillospiraceae bacterium]|nr:S8 family serine peptidase [Oscillospiraceae bacterium]